MSVLTIGIVRDCFICLFSYQEKRPEFENNRCCFVLLFLTVSCLLRTKTSNVKQKLLRAANFNITDYFFPMRFEFSAGPK